jgi:hypothetical protein
MPSMAFQHRLRPGILNSRTPAKIAPPAGAQGNSEGVGAAEVQDPEVGATVEMERVAVPELVSAVATGLVDPKLNAGGSIAPDGLEARAAVSETLPLNPPAGVTVMVEVLPVVAPAVTVTEVPLTEKEGCVAAVTVTTAVALPAEKLASPV